MIEAGANTLTLELHHRLTVLAGMGGIERESLVGELIGALSGSRPGLHLELEERSGRHLAVFRPTVGRHRIVDVDRAMDVTTEFTGPDGSCNLLSRLGLDSQSARRTIRFGAADLAASGNRSEAVDVLSGLDQQRVWAAAEALERADGELVTEAEAIGSSPEDAAIIDEVEARHIAVEQAADRLETTRRRTIWIGGGAALATVPGVVAAGPVALLFAAIALASLGASIAAKTGLTRAAKAEEKALADAGANSYLGFQLQRVNGLLANDTTRRALLGVAESRRTALAEWHRLAGDIPVDWALAHRDEIADAARRRRGIDADGAIDLGRSADEVQGGIAQALAAHLAEARSTANEGLPVVLDDPFRALDAATKPPLLELLGRSAGDSQVVFLTEDPDVIAWARLEALTGDLSLIEPAPSEEPVHHAREAIQL